MFNEVTNVWLYFAAGFMLCFIIQMIGYAIYVSQRDAENLDTRLKLHVYHFTASDEYKVDAMPIRDQDDAQQKLNCYMFSAIRSAHVSDPITGQIIAKMDKNGRLVGVPH